MKYGEIWLVRFPEGVVHEYQKERPALIIESNEQIKKTALITIVPFTSRISNKVADDILVFKNNVNRLFCNSLLKTQHIQSFDRTRFITLIGVVQQNELDKVQAYLKKHFGIV